jgi:hypothetical protein
MKKKVKNCDDLHALIEEYYFKPKLPNGKVTSIYNLIDYLILGLGLDFKYTRNGKEHTYSRDGIKKRFQLYLETRQDTKKTMSFANSTKSISIVPEDMGFEFEEGEVENVAPYVFWQGEWKIMVLSDIHIPYHDLTALKAAINYGRKHQVNAIILNGDIMDMYQCSRFDKSPSKKVLKTEIEMCQRFLQQLRFLFPSEKIIFKIGNHEARLAHYILRKAPELYGIDAINLKELLKLKDLNIDFVDSSQCIRVGKLLIAHGHEWAGGGGGVNAARGMFLKANCNLLIGHFHRSQEFIYRNGNDETIGVWVNGCLANLYPEYLPKNNWNHGFAIVSVSGDGSFELENKKIINGKVC